MPYVALLLWAYLTDLLPPFRRRMSPTRTTEGGSHGTVYALRTLRLLHRQLVLLHRISGGYRLHTTRFVHIPLGLYTYHSVCTH